MSKTVFTNGCFDILHPGHVDLLARARELGDRLVVGLNSDRSVRAIKGADRPINSQEDRRAVLLGLRSVDEVIIFDELTPENLIREIGPDILVKGGDWQVDEIIGADIVRANGGEVVSLPLKSNYSSSRVIEKMLNRESRQEMDADSVFNRSMTEHLDVCSKFLVSAGASIEACERLLAESLDAGKKILVCGNGGSAADAQHIAAEFVGRFERERRALPAISLTTDTSALTALANDYDFSRVFARQVEALAVPGDCLIAISTSGESRNIIAAVMAARKIGCSVVGFTGASGKKLASLSDACVMIPSDRTARIQEGHIAAAHILCEMIDARYE
jgi:D-sedoheptulose 7-phosphate isomerase